MRRLASIVLILSTFCGLGAPLTGLAESDKSDRLVISLAGDCTLGSQNRYMSAPSGFVQTALTKGLDWPFSGSVEVFAADDLTLVNLEGVFTNHEKAVEKSFAFRAPPEFADILTKGSVEAVNLANNHTMDFGAQGFADTQKALDERNIAYCAPAKPMTIEIKGQKIALLGATYPPLKQKMDELCGQIKAFRAQPDIALIIVSFHWGKEMTYNRTTQQADIAHQVIDAGADLVVGTHPHVLQGVELYQGKPVFYSLGNFSFGGNAKPKDFDTVIMQVEYDISQDAPKLVRLEAIPYRISERALGRVQDYRPVKAEGEDAARTLSKLAKCAEGMPDGFFETGRWVQP